MTIEQLTRERDAALAACAEMRRDLSFVLDELQSAANYGTQVYGIATKNQIIDELLRRLPGFYKSLSSDCGRGWLSPEKAKALVEALTAIRDRCQIAGMTFEAQSFANTQEATKALDLVKEDA